MQIEPHWVMRVERPGLVSKKSQDNAKNIIEFTIEINALAFFTCRNAHIITIYLYTLSPFIAQLIRLFYDLGLVLTSR
ncbi:hypothetical protein LVJ85_08510 [Neisseria sp. Dent CA1/247]|uniref:hypothetical protein n=1 Tax=Neisseria sp. Dent CA1/247 TaxID=2912675 RepID=UPI001FD45A60|nr:hypothetical protein [Neisseria sp. Dent CA1/247]UOO76089.1 hypothetical protein LVJ85_08510 [Neisseria sp. Dent CA1/247]